MGIFPRFVETRKYAPSDDYWYNPFQIPTSAGVPVSEKTALNYITVARCVMLISADLARLPLILYRRFADGSKKREIGHPLYDILHDAPNEDINSFQWRESANGHIELWGNHYSYIERDKAGTIRSLWPLPDPGQVEVKRENGQIVYKYENNNGRKVTRGRDQIFHIPGFGFNGIVGLSVINTIRESVGLGLANDEFASKYFGQGMNIGGIMDIPQDLGDQKDEYLKTLKAEHAGMMNSHGILITQNGEKYTQLKMPLRDAQFLEGREFQKAEIAGFYGVPGHKVGIYKTNINRNNTEQENQGYLDSCLIHRISRFESAISQQLLTKPDRKAGIFSEFLIEGLLRADAAGRAAYYNSMFQIAGITPNQIAMKENMEPIGPDGDQRFVMMNLIPLDQAGKEMTLPGDEEPETKPEIEPKVEEKQKNIDFFSEKRPKNIKEERSIKMRDRISSRYKPLILDAAKAVVSRETKAIKNKIANRASGKDMMASFLNDFYAKFPEYIEKKMRPVLTSYLQAIIDESTDEIGGDDANFDKEIKEYVESYSKRHTDSSLGQLLAVLEEKELSDLDQRADEWMEKRPDKIVTEESVRAAGAAFAWVAFGAGLSLVWQIRGAKTCPYCKTLRGKRIKSGQSFVQAGDEIDPKEGTGPMRFFGTKLSPPLHGACDCYTSAT